MLLTLLECVLLANCPMPLLGAGEAANDCRGVAPCGDAIVSRRLLDVDEAFVKVMDAFDGGTGTAHGQP